MASIECPQIHVTVRWWVTPYLRTLGFLCRAMGTTPNRERVTDFIMRRGIKIVRG